MHTIVLGSKFKQKANPSSGGGGGGLMRPDKSPLPWPSLLMFKHMYFPKI